MLTAADQLQLAAGTRITRGGRPEGAGAERFVIFTEKGLQRRIGGEAFWGLKRAPASVSGNGLGRSKGGKRLAKECPSPAKKFPGPIPL